MKNAQSVALAKNSGIIIALTLLGYFVIVSSDFKIIAAGIAIFLVGMVFLEDGFKQFAGGALEEVLKRTTDTMLKAIFSGFLVLKSFLRSALFRVPQEKSPCNLLKHRNTCLWKG